MAALWSLTYLFIIMDTIASTDNATDRLSTLYLHTIYTLSTHYLHCLRVQCPRGLHLPLPPGDPRGRRVPAAAALPRPRPRPLAALRVGGALGPEKLQGTPDLYTYTLASSLDAQSTMHIVDCLIKA